MEVDTDAKLFRDIINEARLEALKSAQEPILWLLDQNCLAYDGRLKTISIRTSDVPIEDLMRLDRFLEDVIRQLRKDHPWLDDMRLSISGGNMYIMIEVPESSAHANVDLLIKTRQSYIHNITKRCLDKINDAVSSWKGKKLSDLVIDFTDVLRNESADTISEVEHAMHEDPRMQGLRVRFHRHTYSSFLFEIAVPFPDEL
jgi:hypothetical protein